MHTVVILGASPKPARYAYKALVKLKQAGYRLLPVHPKAEEIEGVEVISSITEINDDVDTLTLYVGPARLKSQVVEICQLKPRRIIFNPGTEDDGIEQQFQAAGIECVRDCTLIMLDQNRF